MNDDDVAQYLRDNRGFFENHVELLTQIQLPNPHGGQAISLSDRQVQALREENRALKAKLQELIEFAEENDAITGKMHALVLSQLPAASLGEPLATLHAGLREGLSMPQTALRVWGGRAGSNASVDVEGRDEFAPVSDEFKEYAAGLSQPFCGPSGSVEAAGWFGDSAAQVRSVAHIPLRDAGGACIGLLALGSEDVLRFYPDMGTVYLRRLGELTGAALRRFV